MSRFEKQFIYLVLPTKNVLLQLSLNIQPEWNTRYEKQSEIIRSVDAEAVLITSVLVTFLVIF